MNFVLRKILNNKYEHMKYIKHEIIIEEIIMLLLIYKIIRILTISDF